MTANQCSVTQVLPTFCKRSVWVPVIYQNPLELNSSSSLCSVSFLRVLFLVLMWLSAVSRSLPGVSLEFILFLSLYSLPSCFMFCVCAPHCVVLMAGGTTVGEQTNGTAPWPPSASICRAGQGPNTKWLPIEHTRRYTERRSRRLWAKATYQVIGVTQVAWYCIVHVCGFGHAKYVLQSM